MTAAHVAVGAAFGAVLCAAATRRPNAPEPVEPGVCPSGCTGACPCGCLALRIQLAHAVDQADQLREALHGPRSAVSSLLLPAGEHR